MNSPNGTSPTFWHAPELIDAGFRVFPLKDKHPTVEGGFYAATRDKSQVAEWIEDGHAHHDTGVPTGFVSELVVIDADTPEEFEWMRRNHGEPQVLTPRGGHWWFRHPRNGKVSSHKIRAGLDRKADGGYVSVPPSQNRQWRSGMPHLESLPVLPEEFWSKGKRTESESERSLGEDIKEKTAAVIARHVENIASGEGGSEEGRHEHLKHLCGVLLRRNIPLGDAEDIGVSAWSRVDEDLAQRAPHEVLNTLHTTAEAIRQGHATGVPSMERATPGLFGELAEIFGWQEEASVGPKPPERPFPEIDPAAYRGVFGEMVELISPHTEADPVAILLSAITAFGNAYGRRGWVDVSGSRHHGNLFVGIVGDTARARKGTSWAPIENIFSAADPDWAHKRIDSGLSSGEGLINAVRDKIEVPDGEGDTKVADPGVKDKRLLVKEGELSQGLKVLRREGNTLSPILRNAWDGCDLSTMVRHSPLKATEPHISVLGHITKAELLKHVVESEAANGFANRYLWAVVRRSKKLPFGGELDKVDMAPIVHKIRDALSRDAGRIRFADSARDTWVEMYDALTEERPGMYGQITARAEAQTLRLAIIYALADGSNELRAEHLASAYAVWGYCEDSALYLFGDQLGDADADKLLEAIRQSEEGMTRTAVRDLFGRNKKPEELQRILGLLQDTGKAYVTKEKPDGGGRPSEVWWANE